MEIVFILIGVAIGGWITYLVERRLQDRQFQKEAADHDEILKCYLETLKTEIVTDYPRLCALRQLLSTEGYPNEYFDVSVKRTIMSEVIKMRIYRKHKADFDRINSLVTRLTILNREVAMVQDLIQGKYCFGQDQKAKWRQQADHADVVIGQILNQCIQERGGKPEICNKLEEIIRSF